MDFNFEIDAVKYVQQCKLGTNIYGLPFARRSDGRVIQTYKCKSNWVTYPLPGPKIPPRIRQYQKKTCFKVLGLFVVSASLQCIVAFNHGADPWDLLGVKEERSAVSVTFDKDETFLHIGAVMEEQRILRSKLVLQCERLRLPVPEFKGLLISSSCVHMMHRGNKLLASHSAWLTIDSSCAQSAFIT